MQINCYKLDMKKFNWKKESAWNVWIQFGIDLNKISTNIKVEDFYMPANVQDELIDILLAKHPVFKNYKKEYARKHIGLLVLAAFPSSIKPNKFIQLTRYIKYKLRGL